jgi:hypothetical protein
MLEDNSGHWLLAVTVLTANVNSSEKKRRKKKGKKKRKKKPI